MKIAVTAQGDSLDSEIDERFGRAEKFILYDTQTDGFECVDNAQGLNAAQGAGIQAAETVARLGAECVVTGHCGPKAFRTLKAAGLKVYTGARGTVADAIEQFKKGALELAGSADVEGHWM